MSDVPSFMPGHDFAELLWQNGPIVMQGQSNRQKRTSNSTPFPSQNLRVQEKDGRDPAMRKFVQFEDTDSTVNKLSPPVPCANIGLNTHDDDIAHWMNYPIEDPLCSEFFFELAGINPNPRPTERTNGFVAKDFHNVENRNTSKALGEDSEPSKSRTNKLFQSSAENTKPKLAASSIHQGQPQMQDLPLTSKPLHSSSGCGLMNFSHFARPVSLVRTNTESLDRLKANEMMSLTTASTNPMESTLVESSRTLHKVEMRSIVKAKGDVEAICGDVGSRNNPCNNSSVVSNNFTSSNHKVNNQSLSFAASVAVGRNESEKGPEPVVASSSVCSGNSAGAASNDPKHREKRKNLEGEESGYRSSEDLDDESMGLKKPTATRGGTSTKRSRAAEVHNLSERRRRDRINEKMRALQELIPNCNKVDKVSMLDEAIEYLKTLQLQVQMMSMGSGLCMPPMMLPPALQHIRAPPMAHFSPMNVGMGMGMGLSYGMGVLDMNGIPIPSMHTSQFPCTPIPGSSGLQLFGIPGHGQGLPMPFPRPPLFNPLSNLTPTGNSVNEVLGSMSNPLRASDMGPSSRCVNSEAKQNTTNSGAQAQLAQMSNLAMHPSGNAAANTNSSTVNGSNG